MLIEIISRDKEAIESLKDSSRIPHGVNVSTNSSSYQRNLGGDDLFLASISVFAGIPVGLIVNWIWSIMNSDESAKIVINRVITIRDKEDLIKTIKEHIEIS